MTQLGSVSPTVPRIEYTRPVWWVTIIFGMTLTGVLAYNDAAYHVWADNVTTLLPQALIQGIFVVACFLHGLEALYAYRLAASNPAVAGSPIAWGAQTFFMGYASLGLLRKRMKNYPMGGASRSAP